MSIPRVFIGSSSEAAPSARSLVQGLHSKLGENVIIEFWQDPEAFVAGNVLFDRLLEIAGTTDFAILLLTPTAQFGGEIAPNVLYELGLFMGHLERYRTIVVVAEGVNPPSDLQGLLHLQFDANDLVSQIVARINAMGQRVNPEIELAALERMLNVCTPAHPDYDAPHLMKLKEKKDERFSSAGDFFELARCLVRRYVIGSIEPNDIKHLRIYFAIYLGDGIDVRRDEQNYVKVDRCMPSAEGAENRATPKFLIAVSNPARLSDGPVAEELMGSTLINDWLLGQPISGYNYDDFNEPHSTCAKAFADQEEVAGSKDDPWNLPTDAEAEVLAIPVVWRQQPHSASIGVLAISSDEPDIEHEHTGVIQRLRIVANVLGVAADRLSGAIGPQVTPVVGIEIDHTADSRSFARRAVEMRRAIGEFALRDLLQRRKIQIETHEGMSVVVKSA